MASEEHKQLAGFIKSVHAGLRWAGEAAWREHCGNTPVLEEYARCMKRLATTYWEQSAADCSKPATSRIEWAAGVCHHYFLEDAYLFYRNKDIEVAKKIDLRVESPQTVRLNKITLLDVGSCYNPFGIYDYLDVTALDLCPAEEQVLKCDFLNVSIGDDTTRSNCEITELERSSFHAIMFCFVLEYMPSSDQRIEACRRAYDLLKPEGLLVITTPDSKHVGANSKIMKCWRYTLAHLGFSRIKYEKYPYMHCMAFRKSLHVDIAKRWATIHKESYMAFQLNIPQDYQTIENIKIPDNFKYNERNVSDDFKELPEYNSE